MSGLTICGKLDGFGAQLMAMLSGIAYCRYHNIPYVHTPMSQIVPVGTFTTDMNDQLEDANVFVDDIMKRLELDRPLSVSDSRDHMHDEINEDPDAYYTPVFTRYLASGYSAAKPQRYCEHPMNIAVHVRRGDITDGEVERWVEASEILPHMERLRKIYPFAHFHVFSWKDPCTELQGDGVTVHCSDSGKDFLDVFNCFVHADVLIIGASCLSMAAALFNTGKIIAPTAGRQRTNWAMHAIPSRWYWDELKVAEPLSACVDNPDLDDLRKIKVVVLNRRNDKDNRTRFVDRLVQQGFVNLEVVPAYATNGGHSPDSASLLKETLCQRPLEPPFILMTDDVGFAPDFIPCLWIPPGADAICLGRGRLGLVPAYDPSDGLLDGYVCTEYGLEYLRIFNVLDAYCTLFLSDACVDALRQELLGFRNPPGTDSPENWVLAALQKRFLVLTPRVSDVRRDTEGNDINTGASEFQPNRVLGSFALTHQTGHGVFPFSLDPHIAGAKLVVADLAAGLGESLFTIAAAYAYARVRGVPLVIRENPDSETLRGWPAYKDTVLRKLPSAGISTAGFTQTNHSDRYGFVPFEELIDGKPGMVCMQGDYRNTLFFDHCREELVALLSAPPSHIRYYVETKYRLKQYTTILIVGISRLNNHGDDGEPLPVSYYLNAYRHFVECEGRDRDLVVAITDDIVWARENLAPHIPDLVVVDERGNELDLDPGILQFYIMTYGTDFILSGSSFHWWGAYLADTRVILSPAEPGSRDRMFMPKQGQCFNISTELPTGDRSTEDGEGAQRGSIVFPKTSDIHRNEDYEQCRLRAERYLAAHSDYRKRRLAALSEVCQRLSCRDLIVATVNKGFSSMLENWAGSCDRHHIDCRATTVLFPMDPDADRIARDLGFETYFDGVSYGELSPDASQMFRDDVFVKCMFIKIAMVNDVLELGYNVLLNDLDTVWFQDPLPCLKERSIVNSVDLQFMYDGSNPVYSPLHYNSGFVFIVNNGRARQTWKLFLRNYDKVVFFGDDQIVINRIVGTLRNRGLRTASLTADEFLNGEAILEAFKASDRVPDPGYVAHLNYTENIDQKIERLQWQHWWYVDR